MGADEGRDWNDQASQGHGLAHVSDGGPTRAFRRSQASTEFRRHENIFADNPFHSVKFNRRAHTGNGEVVQPDESCTIFPRAARYDRETNTYERPIPGLPLLLIYMASDELVEVVAVFHTSRDPARKRRTRL
jgi:plasmid stabilization system protein ParE